MDNILHCLLSRQPFRFILSATSSSKDLLGSSTSSWRLFFWSRIKSRACVLFWLRKSQAWRAWPSRSKVLSIRNWIFSSCTRYHFRAALSESFPLRASISENGQFAIMDSMSSLSTILSPLLAFSSISLTFWLTRRSAPYPCFHVKPAFSIRSNCSGRPAALENRWYSSRIEPAGSDPTGVSRHRRWTHQWESFAESPSKSTAETYFLSPKLIHPIINIDIRPISRK